MNRRLAVGAFVVLTFALLGEPSDAEAQTATLEGRLTDEQDGALVGATVIVSLTAPPTQEIAITDATGAYRLRSLSPGVYEVTITMPGFQPQRYENVVLRADEVRVLSARLALAVFEQRVDVVAVAPALGGGVDRARVPVAISVIDSRELAERGASSFADTLNEHLGTITLEGVTSNLYQPTLRFLGFTASPLLGLPQGVAVYQNGVRINEPFGDTVQFDLIPQFALEQVQLMAGAEATYGLNALGGALAMRLKNGFNANGFRGEFFGGSFDRFEGTAELGASRGPWAVYLGATRFDETGWRVASASEVTQTFADLAYQTSRLDAGVSFTYADSTLNGNGPAPIELLAADRRAVFTFPDTTDNRLAFGQGRLDYRVTRWLISGAGEMLPLTYCRTKEDLTRPRGRPSHTRRSKKLTSGLGQTRRNPHIAGRPFDEPRNTEKQ